MTSLYIAFSLGLLGSMHCVGMCGPLAIAFSSKAPSSKGQHLLHAMSYNIGRVLTYALIGVLFGIVGSFLVFTDIQKSLSILLGFIMIMSFVLHIDLERKLQTGLLSGFYRQVQQLIQRIASHAHRYPPFVLGAANGLLPCGLVYLALAGAIAGGSVLYGALFMLSFGLGTIPMMLLVVLGYGFVGGKVKLKFRKVLPYATLFFGAFLVYRGMVVDMPQSLSFWEAIKNPILCH